MSCVSCEARHLDPAELMSFDQTHEKLGPFQWNNRDAPEPPQSL